jgi:hypothetical protein
MPLAPHLRHCSFSVHTSGIPENQKRGHWFNFFAGLAFPSDQATAINRSATKWFNLSTCNSYDAAPDKVNYRHKASACGRR